MGSKGLNNRIYNHQAITKEMQMRLDQLENWEQVCLSGLGSSQQGEPPGALDPSGSGGQGRLQPPQLSLRRPLRPVPAVLGDGAGQSGGDRGYESFQLQQAVPAADPDQQGSGPLHEVQQRDPAYGEGADDRKLHRRWEPEGGGMRLREVHHGSLPGLGKE